MRINKQVSARLLATNVTPTGLDLEVWVLHKPNDPGQTIAQVELFKGRVEREWMAWTGSIIRSETKTLARLLATKRNAALARAA